MVRCQICSHFSGRLLAIYCTALPV